jgi:hypothetical protein
VQVDRSSVRFGRAFVLVAVSLLAVSACGQEDPGPQAGGLEALSGPDGAADSPAELPDLARALIPAEALERPTEEELTVKECGIQPAFPCVRVYFVTEDINLEERLALVRAQARSAGWRLLSERREQGVILEIERGVYRGTYMLEPDDSLLCASAPRCITGTMLTVAGPPAALPAPSAAERHGWSAEKKSFVVQANAVCAEMLARMSDQEAVSAALADGLGKLSALQAPSGEEHSVDAILRSLRNAARAAAALDDEEGEDALPAAVALAEFAKRFNRAAGRYGLGTCARLG